MRKTRTKTPSPAAAARPSFPNSKSPACRSVCGAFLCAILPDWHDIAYLQHGSLAQRRAYGVLRCHALLGHLAAHSPVLVGNLPLDFTVPGSDLNIICEAPDLTAFCQTLAELAAFPNYVRQLAATAAPALVAAFEVERLAVEIFGQSLPTARQNGYRHLVVEARGCWRWAARPSASACWPLKPAA